jgi:hypothetical protein
MKAFNLLDRSPHHKLSMPVIIMKDLCLQTLSKWLVAKPKQQQTKKKAIGQAKFLQVHQVHSSQETHRPALCVR